MTRKEQTQFCCKAAMGIFKTLIGISAFSFFIATSYALPIGPDKYYLDGDPGEFIEEQLMVYGRQELAQEQTVYIYPLGMRKVGEEHEREFYVPDPADASDPANWITIGKNEGIITPGDTLIIPWSIEMGSLTECSTNLAAIAVANRPLSADANAGSTIQIGKEIISQVHIVSEGYTSSDCPQVHSLMDFRVNKVIKLFNYDEVPLLTRIQNDGGVITREPKGFIEIFGVGEKITIPFNDKGLDIYPSTVRKFEDVWIDEDYPREGNFWQKLGYEITHIRIGRYEARLGVTKNVDQDIVAYDHFWIIPWRVIVSLITLVIVGVAIGKFTRKDESKTKKTVD